MKFHKFISVILHPIVIPIIGVLTYFLVIPHRIPKEQQLVILGLVFAATYVIPLFILILLKYLGSIASFRAETIQERKAPIIFMIVLFYLLGNIFSKYNSVFDLGRLFYATAFGLSVVYVFFFFKLKTSLHLLSLGNALGFFLTLSIYYTISLMPIIVFIVLISGVLASARLYLKAHTTTEVYLGFFLGIACQFLVFYFL